jgi:hypothetical protein
MQVDLTPDQAQMVANCVKFAMQDQMDRANALLKLINDAFAPPIEEQAPPE